MRKVFLYIIAGTLLLATSLSGCTRRPLDERNGTLAIVPMHIDWSKSKLNEKQINRISVWLFPADGSLPLENNIQGNICDFNIRVPVGEYSILVFNETVKDELWEGQMEFRGTEQFDTFGVYLLEDDSKLVATVRADNTKQPYYKTAKGLAAWSLRNFVVTQNMVDLTRSRARMQSRANISREDEKQVEQMLSAVSKIEPQSLVRAVTVNAKVFNLNTAENAVMHITSSAYGVLLASGEIVQIPVSHLLPVIGGNRDYDDNGRDGTIKVDLLTFGLLAEQTVEVNVNFKIEGEWDKTDHRFDVTEEVKKSDDYELVLNIGNPDPEPEPAKPGQPEPVPPIILPKTDIGSNVEIDGWGKEVVVPVK